MLSPRVVSVALGWVALFVVLAEPLPPQTVLIPMRDGVKLATDLYLPAAQGTYPVILGRTPYNKAAAANFGRDGAQRGYAVVLQDTRGRFASEGENLPFHLDVPDGADALAWIAKQPWCNGRIGTWGGSAGAITQFQLATSEPGNLASQHLVVGAANLYEVIYTGGVFRKALIEDWIRGTRFQDDAVARWVAHPTYDRHWRYRDATRHFRAVNAAGLHIGGYWDIFAQSTIDAFVGYQTRGGPGARGKQKLLLGPWTHGVLQDKAGELTFPNAKRPPNDVQDQWRWFAATLKGETNGVTQLPAVTYYVIGDVTDTNAPGNVWRTADAWPPFPVQPAKLHLHGDRSLSAARPAAAKPLSYRYDPQHPAPTVGGVQLTIPAGPMDQRKLEARDDVLVFTSEPLGEPVEVTGRIRARLWIASDAPDTDFFVKLCDVYPDGRSFNLCEGALRTRFRKGTSREVPLKPGRVEAIDVDCWSTSVIFNRSHRIRVQVTSSSAPGYDPNPNTGDPFRQATTTRVATNSVFVDGKHPSHLLLPVVKGILP